MEYIEWVLANMDEFKHIGKLFGVLVCSLY